MQQSHAAVTYLNIGKVQIDQTRLHHQISDGADPLVEHIICHLHRRSISAPQPHHQLRTWKAFAKVVFESASLKRFWFGITISVSTCCSKSAKPASASLIRCAPGNSNLSTAASWVDSGLCGRWMEGVCTFKVERLRHDCYCQYAQFTSMPSNHGAEHHETLSMQGTDWQLSHLAPVPVPPPIPAVRNNMLGSPSESSWSTSNTSSDEPSADLLLCTERRVQYRQQQMLIHSKADTQRLSLTHSLVWHPHRVPCRPAARDSYPAHSSAACGSPVGQLTRNPKTSGPAHQCCTP